MGNEDVDWIHVIIFERGGGGEVVNRGSLNQGYLLWLTTNFSTNNM
jgi:hypothetical protein